MNYSTNQIPEKEKNTWRAMERHELILWQNKFIKIKDGLAAEYDWIEFSSKRNLSDVEKILVFKQIDTSKKIWYYYQKRIEFIDELLENSQSKRPVKYSPENDSFIPRGKELEHYEGMQLKDLSFHYDIFVTILRGLDQTLLFYKRAKIFNNSKQKETQQLTTILNGLRSVFSGRMKLVVRLIENYKSRNLSKN